MSSHGAPTPAGPRVHPEHLEGLVAVLAAVRSGQARTRPEVARISGLGRNVVAQRVLQLLEVGLLVEGAKAPSTGGRSARELRFEANAGSVLVADLGATSIGVGVADLAGKILVHRREAAAINDGPVEILRRVEELFRELLPQSPTTDLWGVGVGLPGPVEFRTGRPVSPPIMPGWDGFDVRGYFEERFQVPTWVDNDVNLMALGELRAGLGRAERDLVFVKVGTGIGAGLVSGGRLHRGAEGCAGDIGHIAALQDTLEVCRCGRLGCLEALAGGAALARDGALAAAAGRSPFLHRLAKDGHKITSDDVCDAAQHGDPVALELLTRSAELVGESLARIVNFFNPALLVLGGSVVQSGDAYLSTVRQVVFKRSLPLSTRSLRLTVSPLGEQVGLKGAAYLVVDELLDRERLGSWVEFGSPAAAYEQVD